MVKIFCYDKVVANMESDPVLATAAPTLIALAHTTGGKLSTAFLILKRPVEHNFMTVLLVS